MRDLLDILLHVDRHLLEFIQTYGNWVYGLLFAIVFSETGFVVTPFLPGDSLLFATGALCATGALNTPTALTLLVIAAFTGNAVNYTIGRAVGPRIFRSTDTTGCEARLLNREHLARAHAFFEQYGGKALILGRFVPIVRPSFRLWRRGGDAATSVRPLQPGWRGGLGGSLFGAGVLFGNVPLVKEHFSLVTLGIVAISLPPVVIEYIRHRRPR